LGEGKLRGLVEIKAATFLEKKEVITAVAVADLQTLLVGTSQGKLYRYDLVEQSSTCVADLSVEGSSGQ
jgi:hypothetical protein